MKSDRLLICVNDLDYLFSHRKEIIEQALLSGFDIDVVAPKKAKSFLYFSSLGCVMHDLNIDRKGMKPLQELKLMLQFYRLFKQLKPDLVFCITIKPYLYGGIAARLAGVPALVYAIAGLGVISDMRKNIQTLLFQLFKISFAHPNIHIIFQNLEDRDFLIQQGLLLQQQPCTRFFGAGVDFETYNFTHKQASEKTVFFFASRLLKSKGIVDFLKASEQLFQTNKKVEFVVAGAPDFDNLKSISEHELADWQSKDLPIRFLGKLNHEEMIRQYQRCDVFVLPTYYGEGIPKVLIEAAAIGRPSITTNHPGCRDIIRDEHTGLLIEPKDIDGLVKAMLRFTKDKKLTQQLGENARNWVQQHCDVNTIAEQHIDLFKRVLNRDLEN